MRRNKKEIWTNLYIWSFICAFTGIAVCIIFIILFSVFLYNNADVINSFTLFSIFSIISGSLCAGYLCGLFRRNNGLYEGIFCGFIIYIFLLIIGAVFFQSFSGLISIRKLLLCVIPSATGGVIGVNCKRPKKI